MSQIGELVWLGKRPHKIVARETILRDGQPFYIALEIQPLPEAERPEHGLPPSASNHADQSPAL